MLRTRLKSEITAWLHSRRRIVNWVVGLTALLVCEAARSYYRPYIYANAIDDFHIADTLGNSFGTVAAVFVIISLLGRQKSHDLFLLHTVVISALVFEIASPLLGKPIDPWDLVATILAGVFCKALYRQLHKHSRNANITNKAV